MKQVIQTEDPSLVRDTTNHALLNTNSEAYRLYRLNRQSQKNIATMEQRVGGLEAEVRNIQHSLDTIIELLQKK